MDRTRATAQLTAGLTTGAIDFRALAKRQYGHGNAKSGLEGSFLDSLLLGYLDICLFAAGGRTRTGILSKISDQLDRTLVCGTALVPPIAAMGFGMVFQDRHRMAISITAIRLFNRTSFFTRCIRCSHGAWRRLAVLRLRMQCCWCRTSRDCSRSSCFSSWFARNLVINSLSPQSRCSAFFPLRSCCRPGIPSPWHCC